MIGQGNVRRFSNSKAKPTATNRYTICLVALIAASLFLSSCATTEKPLVEAPPLPVVQPDQPQQASQLQPPELHAVQDAVKRVFQESVLIDTSRNPSFLAGDFNGDLSTDVAVILKPMPERLAELNEEFPTWILRDPFAENEPRVPRLRVAANDMLLAVIHGYGANGWRDRQATHTYLLTNVVGSGLEVQQAKAVATANEGKKMPRLRGDVIGEVLRNTPGFLYYAGATYAWYDHKTYKDEPEPGVVHGPPAERVKN
jgi:hypothetical protein